jgi:hypothetical protein
VPLESLAAELRAHLAALRAELVGLINRDFVGLSARLKGVDAYFGWKQRSRHWLEAARVRTAEY